MIKDLLVVRAGPTVPVENVQTYLQFNHAPLAMSTPVVARHMRRYTMNHTVARDHAAIRTYGAPESLASIVEHYLGGPDAIANITSDPEYVARIRPDEHHMVENLMDGPPQFVAIEDRRDIFGAEGDGGLRVFDFVRRPSGLPRGEFLHLLDEEGAWAASHHGYRAAVGARVHGITGDSAEPFGEDADIFDEGAAAFDAVIEIWPTDVEILAGLMSEIRSRRAEFIDERRSLTAVTIEHLIHPRHDRHPVKGDALPHC